MKLKPSPSPEHYAWSFWCPGCECEHGVDKRWHFNGDLAAPTLMPSIMIKSQGAVCHSIVRQGRIQFFLDSTHELRGKTVDLPDR